MGQRNILQDFIAWSKKKDKEFLDAQTAANDFDEMPTGEWIPAYVGPLTPMNEDIPPAESCASSCICDNCWDFPAKLGGEG